MFPAASDRLHHSRKNHALLEEELAVIEKAEN
jgi:hypothetical protein